MARAGRDEDVFFSACLTPSDCYVMMSPIAGTCGPDDEHIPKKNDEQQIVRPTPAVRKQRISRSRRPRLSERGSNIMSPHEPEIDRVESTYDNLDIIQSQYDAPRLRLPEFRREVESQYENISLGKLQRTSRLQPLEKQSVLTQPVIPQPALPLRRRAKESHTPPLQADKRFSKQIGLDIQQQIESAVLRRKDPFSNSPPKFPSPKKVVPQPVQKVDSDLVFPGFKKTGSIDFDARIYRCNELSKDTLGKQSLIAGEENFACAYVNHLGGYLKLTRPQATLFIPPHAILGDPEPVVLYFMSKTNQVGYYPLASCLHPDQFLASPIMYVGKPDFKYSTVDVVLSFPLEDAHCSASFFSVLTVKTFDTSCSSPENAKWRILAPGHDYFFTVCAGRGVLMVSQSAFYVIRATKAAPEYQNMSIPRDTSMRKVRVALFGRAFPESNRAKLHVVFCRDCDKEVERVIDSEERDAYRKLDHVRAFSIETSSGQPIWVTFCLMKNTSWRLQTSSTAKFTPDELFNYADHYPPSVTFALSNPTPNILSAEAFIQCMVVVHEGLASDYQAEGVTSFVHLVGDVIVAKSGQFQSQSLGRASGRRLPVLPVPPSIVDPKGQRPLSSGFSHPPLSPQSSKTLSDCPSMSPPPVPGNDRASVLMVNSYDSQSDTTKARFEEIYVSYQTLAELCLMLQASKAESKDRDWMTFACKIGLSTQQVDRMSDRYTFQSPLSIIHLFFGTCQSATSCCPSTSSREKARSILARLLSIFQEMKRDDLIRVVRRELTRIDQEIDRYSKFLFEGCQFEIRTNVGGGAAAANKGYPRHSFSDGDVTVLTSSADIIKGRLNDIVSWFKTKSSDVFKLSVNSKETAVEDIYEVPQHSNFSVFDDDDRNTYEALIPNKTRDSSGSGKKKDKTAKENEYYNV